MADEKLTLDGCRWKEFVLEDLADVEIGEYIYDYQRIPGDTPYLTATSVNNGVGDFVSNVNGTLEKGCIQINRNGSVGFAAYHPYEALYSYDCRKIRLKHSTSYVSLFIVNQLMMQKDKYGYGYKMGSARLRRQKILLPSTPDGQPDYEFMERYMMSKRGGGH